MPPDHMTEMYDAALALVDYDFEMDEKPMNDTFQHAGTVATTLADRWAWYFAALKNPSEIGKSLKASEDSPQQGYYRTRFKGQAWEPVAIFYPEGSDHLVAYRSGREVRDINETWVWCLRNPITYDAYQRAVDGGGWADDDPTVAAHLAGAGHNSGSVSDIDVLRDQIEAAKAGAGAYAKITDDETAGKAQSLRSRLNELSGEADKKREALKRPHLEAGKAIDKEWQPLVKSAKEAADGIRSALSAYETDKLARQRRAERQAEEARRAAEAAQQPADGEIALAPAPVAAAPVQTQIRGNYGKAASIKAHVVVTKVIDPVALFGFLNGHPELDDCMFKLAQRAIDAGRTVPGIETEEKAQVR